MMHEDGSFFSALDADTEGREGKYYIWSKKEIMNLLGDELGPLYCKVYNICYTPCSKAGRVHHREDS